MTVVSHIPVHRSKALIQAELAIAYVLRGGVAISGVLIAFGLILRVFRLIPVRERSREVIAQLLSGHELDAVRVPHDMPTLLAGLGHVDPDTFVSFGLLLLILLPGIRVAMTVVLFVIERDYIYLGITLLVLAVLSFGMLFGQAL